MRNDNSKLAEPSPPDYFMEEEPLPRYKASLAFYGIALLSTEFNSPFHSNGKRDFEPVLLELNSTQLKIYDLDVNKTTENLIIALYNDQNQVSDLASNIQHTLHGDSQPLLAYTRDLGISLDELEFENPSEYVKLTSSNKFMNKWKKHKTSMLFKKALPSLFHEFKDNKMLFEPTSSYEEFNSKTSLIKGKLLHAYTLANSKIGEAPSVLQMACKEDSNPTLNQNELTLVKSKNTLRLRLELNQLLLQFWSFHGMVNWYRNLLIAKDLSKPIEDRPISKFKSIPTRYNEANNALLVATAIDADNRNQSSPIDNIPSSFVYLTSSSKHNSYQSDNITTDESINDSIFSRSVDGSISSFSEYSVSREKEEFYTEINNFKFVSYERFYTPLEKQYISNCLPDLNTFDRWMGTNVTVSNYENYLTSKQNKEVTETNGSVNIFIGLTKLESPKKTHSLDTNRISCRDFFIDAKGLVSVAD